MLAKLGQMKEKVLDELEHIPKGALPQNELRMGYWQKRMHSLGKKATMSQSAKEVLEECLAYLKKDYPKVEFKYDKEFFNQR